KALSVDVSKYDYVFLGYPIWWDLAPRTVNSFIETADLTGKTVIPFATSGSSSIANSVAVLKKSYPKINWQTGKLLNHVSEKEIGTFVSVTIK
ncbi:MAG: flavodoxin, partial [Prevotella sp.]|nr:flavodoxin [Prevotella sp.]